MENTKIEIDFKIRYRKCPKCNGRKTFMCDEYNNGEYFRFCIRCGNSKKFMDNEKSEVMHGQGTLRWAMKEGEEGFQIGPLKLSEMDVFLEWCHTNKDHLNYAHITYSYSVVNGVAKKIAPKDNQEIKWMFNNILENKLTDYEIEKDYLSGKDIQKDPKKENKKKGE